MSKVVGEGKKTGESPSEGKAVRFGEEVAEEVKLHT